MQGRYGPAVAITLILITTVISLWIVHLAPAGAMVPVHFSGQWTPDHWLPAFTALLVWTGLQLGLWGVFALLPVLRGWDEGFAASLAHYDTIWTTATALLCAFEVAVMETALGLAIRLASFPGFMTGILFIVIGNGLGKIRPNPVLGIRTPWTRASPRVWGRTHRTCGPIVIIAGMLMAAAACGLAGSWGEIWLQLGVPLATAMIAVVVSWWYWRMEQRNA